VYNFDFLVFLMLSAGLSESHGIHLANIGFSPDGRFLLAGSSSETLAFGVNEKREVSLPASIRNLTHNEFAFAGDKIIGVNPASPQKCPVLRFPSGEKVGEIGLRADATLMPAGHGDYVLLKPLAEYPLGVLDITNGKVFAAFKQEAGDIYDKVVLSEQRDGEIALTDLTREKAVETVALNQASLGRPRAIAVSDDLSWLALSGRNRGAVWDLERNIRVAHVRDFRGGWFASDHSAYVDFPKFEKVERSIVRLDSFGNSSIVAPVEKGKIFQMGSYLIAEDCARESLFQRKNCTIKATDFSGKSTIWSRHFDREAPAFLLESSGTLVLYWPASASAVHDELRQFPSLPRPDKGDYLVEVWDLKKKEPSGSLIVKTNKSSFDLKYALSAADWVLVGAGRDRVLTYSLKSGEEVGHVFGAEPALSEPARLYALNNSKNEVSVYDVATSQVRAHYSFPSSVSYKKFSADGKRLFVLTSDQTAYVLDLSASDPVAKSASN
jgi:WD40 repeat protein